MRLEVQNFTLVVGLATFFNYLLQCYLAVGMDKQGIIPEELETALQSHYQSHPPRELTQRKPFWSMLYIMPTFHNPTGVCLPPGKLCNLYFLVHMNNLLMLIHDDNHRIVQLTRVPP